MRFWNSSALVTIALNEKMTKSVRLPIVTIDDRLAEAATRDGFMVLP